VRNPLFWWLVAALVAGPASPAVNTREVGIRWAVQRHALMREVEYLLRAQLRLENGRPGSEAGMNPPKSFRLDYDTFASDKGAYVDPTMPDGCVQYSRLSRRLLISMQRFILSDEWTRKKWLQYHVRTFHAGATPEANAKYYDLLKRLWAEERERGREAVFAVEGAGGPASD
jgi:hypothetical protein